MLQKSKLWLILSVVLAISIILVSLPTFAYRSESDIYDTYEFYDFYDFYTGTSNSTIITGGALGIVTPTLTETPVPTETPSQMQTRVMEYDALGRLIRITYSSGLVVSYTYDSVGNLIEVSTRQ